MTRRLVMMSVVLLGAAVMRGSAAPQPIEIRLNGHYFAEPATIRVLVTVEPDAANRTLRIEADGDRLFRSTEVTLDGDSEKRLHTVEFKNLPAGDYQFRAEVLSSSHVRGMASDQVTVTGSGNRER